MKIETITVMERKNLGNYEHIEISASAKVEEGDDAYSSLLALKTIVHAALEGKAATMSSVPTAKVEKVKHEIIQEIPLPIPEKVLATVKEKKAKKEKEEVPKPLITEGSTTSVTSDGEKGLNGYDPKVAKDDKNVIVYNRDLDTHRQLLSSFLNKNHPSWKTTEGVKNFSMSLVGKPFLNNDGAVVESFAKLLSDFFNA
jgi:hypothetical protein